MPKWPVPRLIDVINKKRQSQKENLPPFTICSMCSEGLNYKELLAEAQEQIYELETIIDKLKNADSSKKLLKDISTNNVILLDLPSYLECKNLKNTVKMITITFDPKKFPVLFDKDAQRSYIIQSLEELISTDWGCNYQLGEFYGCFELHDSGVVHAHLIMTHIHIEELHILKMKFTDNRNNINAIHCCEKTYDEALAYINKKETKDKHNSYNYFKFKKTLRNPNLDLQKKTLKNMVKKVFP